MNIKDYARLYIDKEIPVVPAHNKAPKFKDWQNAKLDEIMDIPFWDKANGLNMLMGKPSGIIAIDIDIIEENNIEIFTKVMKLLPPIYCGRLGNPKKQPTRFFQYRGEKARKFNNIQVEILSDGNNCCMPPGYNHQSKTRFKWVKRSLLDIEIDELPILDSDIIDQLDALNNEYKKTKKKDKKNELAKRDGGCNHGSHNIISELGVALVHKGYKFDLLVKRLLEKDKEINANADTFYFNCKSRPWKSNDGNENANAFVDELFRNHGPSGKYTEESKRFMDAVFENINESLAGHLDSKPSMGLQELYKKLKLDVNGQGNAANTESTVIKLLAYDDHYRDGIIYDDFSETILIKNKSKKMRPLRDDDYLYMLLLMQSKYEIKRINKNVIQNAVESFARFNTKNLLTDWIMTHNWDAKQRIETFFIDYCGSEDTPYVRQVSLNFWISMMARAFDPGCKVDNMVILEGPQGVKKSSMLKAIGGDWYGENTAAYGDKDFYQNMKGLLLIEIAELDTFSKAELNTIKRVTSAQSDKYRASYGRNTVNHPRKCIFFGTTNETEYLHDMTGGRRFWPVKCEMIDLDAVKKDREMLFAEAFKLYKHGVNWYEEPPDVKAIQESRRVQHPWEDDLKKWAEDKTPFKTSEAIEKGLGIEIKFKKKSHTKIVTDILRSLGYVYKNRKIKVDYKIVQAKTWALPEGN